MIMRKFRFKLSADIGELSQGIPVIGVSRDSVLILLYGHSYNTFHFPKKNG